MKKIIVFALGVTAGFVSVIIGVLCFLYRFKESDWDKGSSWLDDQTNWVDRLEKQWKN